MTDAVRWRLLLQSGASGYRNMAVDEALLLSQSQLRQTSWTHTLRFFWFEPPALSIGAFQPLEEVRLVACREAGVDVVRRPTGGRAVLHDGCVTYSLSGPVDGPIFAGGVRPSYQRIAEALTAAVRALGAHCVAPASPAMRSLSGPSCFDGASPYELLSGGRKLAGSAQVRRGVTALQHGSLRLTRGRIPVSALLRYRAGRPDALSHDEPPVLSDLTGSSISRECAAIAIQEAFATLFGVVLVSEELTNRERRLAACLEARRYRLPAWTERR